ncbi:alpha-hydroxy acid oxidase [Micromonospora sonchi]|uniref:alpha-hydroxy acid oxidase n=1 Tax=Micromonospora sonchi TaxID=1763543 RepID=UPI0035712B42
MLSTVAEAHSVDDLRRWAETVLPSELSDFIAGGSGTESTMAANRAALDRLTVVPRVLRGGPDADPATTLFGSRSRLPFAVAPMAYQRLFHPDGELATARAAAAAGVPFVISTLSSVTLEELAEIGGERWFQLYWLRDDAETLDLVRRAEQSGCRALMVTADVPVMGRRLRDVRNGFALPPHVRAANLRFGARSSAHETTGAGSAVAAHTRAEFHPALTWDHLDRLRSCTGLPIVVKGVLDPADAQEAAARGMDGVVVSNHGGRQLDGAVASLTVLPQIVEAVGGRCRVLMDSGIRSGADVLRAVAVGAAGVLVGRPMLWGLAADGEAGAALVLSLLGDELREAMRLSGCADLAAVRDLTTRVVC